MDSLKGDEVEESEFKEPPEHDGKLRWQIIRLMPMKFKSLMDRDQDTPVDSTSQEKDRLTEALEKLVAKDTDVRNPRLVVCQLNSGCLLCAE